MPAASLPLGGIVAASLTPVTEAFRIDVDRLRAHLQWLLKQGCSFVSPFGSTGEGPSFSVREKTEVLKALSASGFDMGRVVPAAMSAALDDTAATIALAAELRCRAVLVVPPYYYGAEDAGIADVFSACAVRLGGTFPIDIVLYHIPQLTRAPFTPELIDELLSRHGDRIVGIKDSTGIEAQTLELCRRFPQLRVFTGDDRVLPALIAAGGAGMIGGMPNVVARDLAGRLRSRESLGDPQACRNAAMRIAAVEAGGGIVALKALKALTSDDGAWRRPVPPLMALDGSATSRLVDAFAATGFDFGQS